MVVPATAESGTVRANFRVLDDSLDACAELDDYLGRSSGVQQRLPRSLASGASKQHRFEHVADLRRRRACTAAESRHTSIQGGARSSSPHRSAYVQASGRAPCNRRPGLVENESRTCGCIGVDVTDLSAGLISRLSGQRCRGELTCPVDGFAEHVRSRSPEIATVVVNRPLYRYRYTRCRGPGDVLAASHPDGSSQGWAVTDRTRRVGRHQPSRGLHLRIRQTVSLGRHPVPPPRGGRLRGSYAAGRT